MFSARGVLLAAIAVLVIGRLVALVIQLSQAVPSAFVFEEDAYYVFAVARNLAHGHGITADGSQWTNGFQPLWALLVTLPYLVFADDRVVLASVCAFSAVLWLTSAYLFARLTDRLVGLTALRSHSWLPLAIVVLFLADLQLQGAYFNGLETGLYLTCVLALLTLIKREAFSAGSIWSPLCIGAGLGLTILARNDGIFLASALLLGGVAADRSMRTVRGVILAGGAMTAIVLPWLAFNVWLTGSPVPQSGAATNAGPYANALSIEKAGAMVSRLAQLTFTPFPMNYSTFDRLSAPAAGLMALAALGICVALVARRRSLLEPARLLWPLAAAVICLCAYYLVASGAVWMYDRYLMPFKLLSIALWAMLLVTAVAHIRPVATVAVALGVVTISLYYQASAPSLGSNMTADLLWLKASALSTSSERIGMFESGRAGYAFPDRVENLDGKTNLDALRAIQSDAFLQYLEGSDLDVLVFREYYEPWLDSEYPAWRSAFTPAPTDLEGLVVSRRVSRRASQVSSQ